MKYLMLALAAMLLVYQPAAAQEALPALPAPIQNLVDEGAQIRFMGKDHGFDAWLTVKNGQEQYFYVLPDGSAFVMGVLFDANGKAVTVQQVQRLQQGGDPMLDELASDVRATGSDKAFELQSPAERLFSDIEGSNWIALGGPSAPVIYSFIDPQCPHCHAFINDLRKGGYLEQGRIQLRMIPVGFREETLVQAAFLLAAPEPGERFLKHMDGDASALPAKRDINTQGVQRNLAVMQTWDLTVTPLIVYRDKAGGIKIVRGRPKDVEALAADIGAGR